MHHFGMQLTRAEDIGRNQISYRRAEYELHNVAQYLRYRQVFMALDLHRVQCHHTKHSNYLELSEKTHRIQTRILIAGVSKQATRWNTKKLAICAHHAGLWNASFHGSTYGQTLNRYGVWWKACAYILERLYTTRENKNTRFLVIFLKIQLFGRVHPHLFHSVHP